MFASAARRSNCMCPTALKSARRAPTKAQAVREQFARQVAELVWISKALFNAAYHHGDQNASKCFIARGRKECPGLDKPGLRRAALHLALGLGLCRGSHGGENLMGRRSRDRRDAALVQFAEWEEWVTLVVGLAVAASPWVLGFAALHHALAAWVVLGLIVALASITEIWSAHHPAAIARQ